MELTEVDYTPKKITQASDLVETCFHTSGMCYLLLPQDEVDLTTFAAIDRRINARKRMRLYIVDLLPDVMFESDGRPPIIALNGGKRWYKRFDGDLNERDVVDWIHSVKLGEGQKLPINEQVLELFGLSPSNAGGMTETA